LLGDWLSISVLDGTTDNHIDRLTFELSEDLHVLSLTSVFYRFVKDYTRKPSYRWHPTATPASC